jgi:hypothetical protein
MLSFLLSRLFFGDRDSNESVRLEMLPKGRGELEKQARARVAKVEEKRRKKILRRSNCGLAIQKFRSRKGLSLLLARSTRSYAGGSPSIRPSEREGHLQLSLDRPPRRRGQRWRES